MTAVMPLGLRRTGKDEGAEQIFLVVLQKSLEGTVPARFLYFLLMKVFT